MSAAQYIGIGMLASFFLAAFMGMRGQIGTRGALEVFGATLCVTAFLVGAVFLIATPP